jgi:hypothetical protein
VEDRLKIRLFVIRAAHGQVVDDARLVHPRLKPRHAENLRWLRREQKSPSVEVKTDVSTAERISGNEELFLSSVPYGENEIPQQAPKAVPTPTSITGEEQVGIGHLGADVVTSTAQRFDQRFPIVETSISDQNMTLFCIRERLALPNGLRRDVKRQVSEPDGSLLPVPAGYYLEWDFFSSSGCRTAADANFTTLVNCVDSCSNIQLVADWYGKNGGTFDDACAQYSCGSAYSAGEHWARCSDPDDNAPSTLEARLSGVQSSSGRSGIQITWFASIERDHVAYNIIVPPPLSSSVTPKSPEHVWDTIGSASRTDAATSQLVSPKILSRDGVRNAQTGAHRYSQLVRRDDIPFFYIEDINTRNESTLHGPFTVGATYGTDWSSPPTVVEWRGIHRTNDANAAVASSAPSRWRSGDALLPSALLWVGTPGVVRVSFDELREAGVDWLGVPVAEIALTDNGAPEARYIEDADGLFGPGDFVEFVGDVTPSLYSNRNAYLLQRDENLTKPASLQGPAEEGEIEPFLSIHEQSFEKQREYRLGAVGDDPWYDEQLLAMQGDPVRLDRDFDLHGYGGGDVELTVAMWGVGNWPGVEPADHHLLVYVNGKQLGDRVSYDGVATPEFTFSIPEQLVRERGNILTLEAPGDTEFAWDIQMLDRFSIRYARWSQTVDGSWSGTLTADHAPAARVAGFEGNTVAWANGQVRVTSHGENTIIRSGSEWRVADDRGIRRATIEPQIPSASRAPPVQTDYLIVTHPFFADHLGSLLALQESRGLSTAVVTVDEIYASYSDFEPSAAAIREFIAKSDAKFVLLVGADTYDYHDYLGLGSISYVPTHYVRTNDRIRFTPSDSVHADRDGDGVPDVPVGRLPVRTLAELESLVEKLTAFQVPQHAVFAASESDRGRDFATASESYAQRLPENWTASSVFADDVGTQDAPDHLIEELGRGGSLVSYYGHSSFAEWGSRNVGIVLNAPELDQIVNSDPHLIMQWGCWNTYFVEPRQETMANAFLFHENGGAAGVVGASTLTDGFLLSRVGESFFDLIDDAPTLGEALLEAQRAWARQEPGRTRELHSFVLLGDPATPLELPSEDVEDERDPKPATKDDVPRDALPGAQRPTTEESAGNDDTPPGNTGESPVSTDNAADPDTREARGSAANCASVRQAPRAKGPSGWLGLLAFLGALVVLRRRVLG